MTTKRTKALGIDPGFASVGYAVLCDREVTAMGVIRTQKSAKKRNMLAREDNVRRAAEIYHALDALLIDDVDVVCAESMSFPRNASNAAKMAMCWGVLVGLIECHGLSLQQSSPQEIKRAVCGDAQATKADVESVLIAKYPETQALASDLPRTQREHAFDALGAIVAALDGNVMRALQRAA